MDGYIKNKQQAIRSQWRWIFGKYSVSCILLLACLLLLFGQFIAHQHPNRWKEETVKVSGVGEMWLLLNRDMSDALITEDGRQFHTGSAEKLQGILIPGDIYTIIYSNNLKGKCLEGLSKDGTVYIDVKDSAQQWRENSAWTLQMSGVLTATQIIAIILIDRLWCKKEHAQMKRLKADIAKREMWLRNKNAGGQ